MPTTSPSGRTLPLLLLVLLLIPSGIAGAKSTASGEPARSDALTPVMAKFEDINDSFAWARPAIVYTAQDRTWMQDFGTDTFRPKEAETRRLFARAIVLAFGDPDQTIDPDIVFTDLPQSDPFYRSANIAVQNGWMARKDGGFAPGDPVTLTMVYRALVRTLPLSQEEAGLDDIHTANGYRFVHPTNFPTTLLGMRLGLRYNHPNESDDILPNQPMPRAEVAYALYRRAIVSSATVSGLAIYRTTELPTLDTARRKIVEWSLRYVGYPYIWGGEWDAKRPDQLQGGFDCSGLMWWVIKKPGDGFDNSKARGYAGWKLSQRTSASMASVGNRISFANAAPGDLLFYDGTGDGTVDHVDLYVGNGWAIDSSSGVGGVTLLNVSSGWYRDHFEWGRRIIPA